MIKDLAEFLVHIMGAPLIRRWKKSHPRLVEGLKVLNGARLPPSYIFRYKPSDPPSDPESQPDRYAAWGRWRDGIYADKTIMSFALSNDERTLIWDLRIIVTAHYPPLQGWVYHPPPIGGADTTHTITASLDSVAGLGLVRVDRTRLSDDLERDEAWDWPRSVSNDSPLWLIS